MELTDVCDRVRGGTAAILGNGPTLSDHSPGDVHDACDVVLGVNRAWQWGPLDWWVTLDLPPWREAQRMRPPALSQANWAVLDAVVATMSEPWLPHPGALLRVRRNNSRPVKRLTRGMETKAYAETGTLPDSDNCGPHHGMDRLMTYSSSTMAAIHLALYLGCTRLELHGIDLSFPRGRQRFCDRASRPDDKFDETRSQFALQRQVLEEFADEWGDRLTLICHSPAAHLRGWGSPSA